MVLNTGVATSCSLWVLFTRGLPVGATASQRALAGALAAPLPLWFIPQAVVDTVYFLFTPWAARFLARLPGSVVSAASNRSRLLIGVAALQGPLRRFSDAQESYAWLVSVAFGHAQRLMAAYSGF